MEQDIKQSVIIEPIIDAQTPPISVDTVSIGQGSSQGLRLVGFAGSIYAQREEILAINSEEVRRLWVRPVSVIDLSADAVRFLEEYLLYNLSEKPERLNDKEKFFPGTLEKLKMIIEGIAQ